MSEQPKIKQLHENLDELNAIQQAAGLPLLADPYEAGEPTPMSDADPSDLWTPADDLDRLLEYVWMGALAATTSNDAQEDIHECPACGEPHMRLDEAKYVERQRAILIHARKKLDALLAGESTP